MLLNKEMSSEYDIGYIYEGPSRVTRIGNRLNSIPPGIVILITVIVVIIIFLITAILISRLEQGNDSFQASMANGQDITNLNNLLNINDSLVCVPESGIGTTRRILYHPDSDRIYSLDPVNSSVACSGLSPQDESSCINDITDENGEVKTVAYFGINQYYLAGSGNITGQCLNFVTQ